MDVNTLSFYKEKDSNTSKPYIYALIRKDISFEQQLVQIGHASYHAGKSFPSADTIPSFIALECANQKELLDSAERLKRYNIDFELFYEPSFGPMGYSSLCTRPLTRAKDRKIMWKWSTYKFQQENQNV